MANSSVGQTAAAGKKGNAVVDWIAHGGKPKTTAKKAVVIGMLAFAIMNVTTIVSLRGMPAQAEYGLTSIFYYVFAAVVFLIPVSLVAAELASAFPNQGGVFRWVGEAFGPRWGFAAIYYQWQAIVIWFPTVLIFAATALAYICWPQSFDAALSNNKFYMIAVLLAVYWFVTIFTFRGIAASSKLSSLGGLFGTIIPGAILIVLGVAYVAMGKPIHMPLHTGFVPNFGDFRSMVLAAGIFLYFAGMEMQAVHVRHLKNPSRNYPLSVLIATILVVAIFVLGTLAVGVVIPQKAIDLNQSLLIAYRDFGRRSACLGSAMSWRRCWPLVCSAKSASSSRGLRPVFWRWARPVTFRICCKRRMPMAFRCPFCCCREFWLRILCAAFTVLPSIQSAYQILSQMATIIYLVMYLIMYVAAIRLRYSQPDKASTL